MNNTMTNKCRGLYVSVCLCSCVHVCVPRDDSIHAQTARFNRPTSYHHCKLCVCFAKGVPKIPHKYGHGDSSRAIPQLGKCDWAFFGTQSLASQTPSPRSKDALVLALRASAAAKSQNLRCVPRTEILSAPPSVSSVSRAFAVGLMWR